MSKTLLLDQQKIFHNLAYLSTSFLFQRTKESDMKMKILLPLVEMKESTRLTIAEFT